MTAGIQRPLRGSRITTFYPIKTLPSLSSLDSAFQLQEYISLLIRLDIHDIEAITSLPGKEKDGAAPLETSEGQTPPEEEKDEEKGNAKGDVVVDEACWVYEQLRRLAQDLTQPLITTLQLECTRATCPEMKAGEWLYLCVAHGNEGAMEHCCAIDYIVHTLDSATALLNSPRAFPSRLQIPPTSHRHFSSLARRLGRIFAHAYFHHREAFEQAEAESSLYARFLALSSKFELVPPEFLPIPPAVFASQEEGYDRDVPPPRLDAAALNHLGSGDHGHSQYPPESSSLQNPFSIAASSSSEHLSLTMPESKGHSPPGLGMEASPRRMGRNRTGTMVPSDASMVVEELTRAAEVQDLLLNPTDDFAPSVLTARPPPEKHTEVAEAPKPSPEVEATPAQQETSPTPPQHEVLEPEEIPAEDKAPEEEPLAAPTEVEITTNEPETEEDPEPTQAPPIPTEDPEFIEVSVESPSPPLVIDALEDPAPEIDLEEPTAVPLEKTEEVKEAAPEPALAPAPAPVPEVLPAEESPQPVPEPEKEEENPKDDKESVAAIPESHESAEHPETKDVTDASPVST